MEATKRIPQENYSLWSNLTFAIKLFWREKKSTVIFCFIAIFARVSLPFMGILLPKLVIDELTNKTTPDHFITVVGGAALLLVILNFIKRFTDAIVDDSIGTIAAYTTLHQFVEKQIDMDYALLEDPEVKTIFDKAERASSSNHSPALNIPRTAVRLSVNILGLLLYGGVILNVHPTIIFFLALSAGINWFCLARARSYEKATREERSVLSGQTAGLRNYMSRAAYAKDIRLYSLAGFMQDISSEIMYQREQSEGKVATRNTLAGLTDALLILLRDGAAYAYLVYLLLNGDLPLGDFVFIFAAIGAFAGWMSGVVLQSSELFRSLDEMSDIRAFLDIPDKSNTGKGAALPSGNALPPAITLKNVGYTYPGAELPTLHGVNIEIKAGERIAVVGANGAGKTTLIKLICGLYAPTEGSISLGGVEIGAYNRDEYFSLFAAVFQDIHLVAENIAENISQAPPGQTDMSRVEQCLKLAGLYDKVQSLPERERTMLVRRVNDEAIEFSGGEKQKLAMARALYKDAAVVILDEPTAALDPIAENEVYQRYAELTAGKTSLYISHRLASTRFCDRILFIEDGKIAEEGSHEELMLLGGKYAQMFEIQAHYYSEQLTVDN